MTGVIVFLGCLAAAIVILRLRTCRQTKRKLVDDHVERTMQHLNRYAAGQD